MIAFVSALAPVGVTAFAGRAVCSTAISPVPVSMAMSKSVPFLEKPKNLDGLAAGVEFDPLGISNYVSPAFLVEAELKHGRICTSFVPARNLFHRFVRPFITFANTVVSSLNISLIRHACMPGNARSRAVHIWRLVFPEDAPN
jgi:Chlorophyll A-B binding protein